ncbi:uncharacterized protein LOC119158615 isoform X2 [Falco rusticolus]|uniref:uncharacterized protein LOC119158615 isoform X2 n=1 Tax=Falco rusticolus TaxID=120794 RepID=UPI00188661EB|nr:uncharacterized protein LOC119158615 isoform X2 [Falco rusticolus]
MRGTVCHVQGAACCMQGDMCHMQGARCHMQGAACKVPHARCSMPRVRCSVLHARCSVPRVRCSMLHARCSVQRATCKVQRATCHVPRATCSRAACSPAGWPCIKCVASHGHWCTMCVSGGWLQGDTSQRSPPLAPLPCTLAGGPCTPGLCTGGPWWVPPAQEGPHVSPTVQPGEPVGSRVCTGADGGWRGGKVWEECVEREGRAGALRGPWPCRSDCAFPLQVGDPKNVSSCSPRPSLPAPKPSPCSLLPNSPVSLQLLPAPSLHFAYGEPPTSAPRSSTPTPTPAFAAFWRKKILSASSGITTFPRRFLLPSGWDFPPAKLTSLVSLSLAHVPGARAPCTDAFPGIPPLALLPTPLALPPSLPRVPCSVKVL